MQQIQEQCYYQVFTDFVTTIHLSGAMLLIIYVHEQLSTTLLNLTVAPTNQPMQPNLSKEGMAIYSKCTPNQVVINNKKAATDHHQLYI